MNEIDPLSLDGHGLALFLAVMEEGSVTAAAHRLDLTQSAVSHGLQKLRRIVGDPLFVKSGRGIVATAHAHALAEKARRLIDGLEDFTRRPHFETSSARLSLTIAANDFQAELLLPEVYRRLARAAASVALRIIPSGAPGPELLRERRCDLLLTPMPPDGADLMRRRLFEDQYRCFFDGAHRGPPVGFEAWRSARHITVVHAGDEPLEFDRRLAARGIVRAIDIKAQGFAGVPSFLKGSDMLATLPGLLARGLMRGFSSCEPPPPGEGDWDARLPMYMVWHRRDHLDPAHGWLRDVTVSVAQEARWPGTANG